MFCFEEFRALVWESDIIPRIYLPTPIELLECLMCSEEREMSTRARESGWHTICYGSIDGWMEPKWFYVGPKHFAEKTNAEEMLQFLEECMDAAKRRVWRME